VPEQIRNRDRTIGTREPILPRYERIAFDKSLIASPGRPQAAFICPGHPLLDSVIDLTLERNRDLFRRGTILVDDRDEGTAPRVLFFLEHAIQDAGTGRSGERRIISKRILFVELSADGSMRHIQYAPYLDYRPLGGDDPAVSEILARTECGWISRDIEQRAVRHAVDTLVPGHLDEVKARKLALIAKTETAVKERLTKEISFWDHRAEELKLQEQAGKTSDRLNSGEARKRADILQGRLERRIADLRLERMISSLPPVALGGLLVIPAGLLRAMTGKGAEPAAATQGADKLEAARKAREIVMEAERRLGFEPVDREEEKLGYDIESRVPGTGKLRFIEVKGRVSGAETITVTKNEVLYSLNKPDDYILAVVEFLEDGTHRLHYIRRPFHAEPDFGVTSVNYGYRELLERAKAPE
jgi:hypothetical protein